MDQIGLIIHSLAVAAYAGLLVYAAWSDARTLEIANSVSIVLAAAFLPAAWLSGMPLVGLAWHLGVGLAFLILGMVAFFKGLTGAADVKLLSAAAVWAGPGLVGGLLIVVALWGGALALVTIVVRRYRLFAGLTRGLPWLDPEADQGGGQPIPYGIAIALGGLCLLPALPVLPPQAGPFFKGLLGG